MIFFEFFAQKLFSRKEFRMNFSLEVQDFIRECTDLNEYFNKNPTAPKIYILVTTKVFFVTFFVNYKTPISEELADRWFLSWENPISKKIYLPKGNNSTKIFISNENIRGSIIIRETSDTNINIKWCAPTYEIEYFLDEGYTVDDMKRYIYNHIHEFFIPDSEYFEGDIYNLGVYTQEEGY
jgi:hypothetical protein